MDGYIQYYINIIIMPIARFVLPNLSEKSRFVLQTLN